MNPRLRSTVGSLIVTVSGAVLSGADVGRLFMTTPGCCCWATGAMPEGTTVACTTKAKLHRPLQSIKRSYMPLLIIMNENIFSKTIQTPLFILQS